MTRTADQPATGASFIDLNDVWQPLARIDLREVRARLADRAHEWLPVLFPEAVPSRDRKTLRCADLTGRAPRGEGSCVLHLEGRFAGCGFDYATNEYAGPIDLIYYRTGLTDTALFQEAARLARMDLPPPAPRLPSPRPDHSLEIARILNGCTPLADTRGQVYLRSRGLDDPGSPDLLYHDDLTDHDTARGYPGIVAVVRDGTGQPTGGIHRTFLLDDGSGKAAPGKKMLGPVAGGHVRLAPMGADGHLGVAEGIENALAAKVIFGIPTWAGLSADGVRRFQWPEGTRHLTIFADAGEVGMQAATALAERAAQAGLAHAIVVPRHGDDLTDDLAHGVTAADYQSVAEEPPTFDALMAAVEAMPEGGGVELGTIYARIAATRLEIFQEDRLYALIRGKTRIAIPTSRRQVAALRREIAGTAVSDAGSEPEDPRFDADVAQMAASYPLPQVDGIDLRLLRSQSGEILVHRNMGRDKDGRTTWQAIASPFGVPGRLRYLDLDDAYGLRVVICDMHGAPRRVDFPRASIAQQGAQEIRSALFAAGLRTFADGDQVVMALLKAVNPQEDTMVVSRPGWHRLQGHDHPVFVTPAGRAIGNAPALELVAHARNESVRGTLDGWKAATTVAAAVTGCPHFALGTLVGFSGVVQSLAGLDSCGLNLSGLSSSGKTTAQRLAVSAWTSTVLGSGLLQSMRSTENAVEVFAQAASGTVLALDELAHVDGRVVAKLIYAIAGGQGKARMTAGAVLKQRYAWSTYALLSSECSLEEKIRADGGAWIAGMAVRILDVDVTDIDREVPTATMSAIEDVEKHHGHAGPAFVERLIAAGLHRTPDRIREFVFTEARRLAGDRADSARLRAASCLALPLVAGRLAQHFDILPSSIDIEAPVQWAWARFQKSSDAEALVPGDQVVSMLRAWIAERWDVTVKAIDTGSMGYDHKLNNREAVAWYDHDAIYIPAHRLREAAGGTLKAAQITKILIDRDMVARRHNDKRAIIRFVSGIGRIDAYALKRSKLGRSGHRIEDDEDP